MTDAVAVELIKAVSAIATPVIAALGGYWALKAAKTTKETREVVGGIAVKVDGLLDARVKAAGDLGTAEGHAAGVQQERDR